MEIKTATESNIDVTETNIVQFPVKATEMQELQVFSWVNQPNILVRNRKAKQYIQSCEANHEDLECLIGSLSVFTLIVAISFLAIVLL